MITHQSGLMSRLFVTEAMWWHRLGSKGLGYSPGCAICLIPTEAEMVMKTWRGSLDADQVQLVPRLLMMVGQSPILTPYQ